MNWKSLYFGQISREDIQRYIDDPDWQELRLMMKGMSLEDKYSNLKAWLRNNHNSHASKVQVTNYVTALSRGGLIKPSDYLE